MAASTQYGWIFHMQNEKEVKLDIRSLSYDELEDVVSSLNEPSFRTKQIFQWLSKDIGSFDDMTNISKSLRAKLSENYYIYRPVVLKKQVSEIDGTIKYLWELEDGNAIETVLMSYHYGNTICISTQVGCRQGCAFCASTIGGLVRNLTPSEMLSEVIFTQAESGKTINNIVLMGIGEPLDNFENVIKFLQLVNDPRGVNIGMRHITISTCGIVEKFDKLASYNLQLTLTVSLHGPDDETRSKIMPANQNRGVDLLLKACSDYYHRTGRRISFEYAMIDGVNDSEMHAHKLADCAKKVGAHINLITLNYVEERPFKPTTEDNMKLFLRVLDDSGVNYTVRRKLGSDVDASCGQLRRKQMKS